MRVISCMLVMALLCLTGSGCSLFKKNNTGGTTGNNAIMPPPKFPAKAPDPLLTPPAPPPTFPAAGTPAPTPPNRQTIPASSKTTILAGTVIDIYHRPIGNAYIRPVNLEEKDAGAPIDVAADASGHFIIQGVKPGASYKLIARTKQGDKVLAGMVFTTAPNVRVVIPIREDFANGSTPPLPAAPAQQSVPNETGKAGDTNPHGTAWNIGPAKPATEPNLPATMNVPAPTGNTQVGNPSTTLGAPTFVPGIVDIRKDKDRLPLLNIPGNRPTPAPDDAKLDTGVPRIPSCVVVGSRLENLALKDSKGQVWEYRKQGKGKLVLIDFWGTYCIYCRQTMPTLDRLQKQYGPRGLEVIGIALEPGKDERKEAEAVNKVCNAMQIQYRQLMGHVGTFDAGKHFRIEGVPTLLLLNDRGDIIWHHVGRPDSVLLNSLERTIQDRLGNRAF